MKKLFISVLIILIGGGFGFAWLKVNKLDTTMLSNLSAVNIEVTQGDTLYRVNQRLLKKITQLKTPKIVKLPITA